MCGKTRLSIYEICKKIVTKLFVLLLLLKLAFLANKLKIIGGNCTLQILIMANSNSFKQVKLDTSTTI